MKPTAAWTFSASAKTRDFRKSWWDPMSLKITDNKTEYKMEPPKVGYEAAFIDLEFELDGIKYNLSTPLRILGPAK
jgi:PhoPQ-activated pathogenicity-related protein